MTDLVITLNDEALSDGSKVWSVIVRDQRLSETARELGRAITIPAITFQDAIELSEKLQDALNAHTNMQAAIR